MRALRIGLFALASLASTGCTLANLTPQARFSEAAYTLNDASRWSNVSVAMSHVSPVYMERFAERHRLWGESISIAEVELLQLRVAEDKKTAVSEINLSWYDDGGVTLRSSVVTQSWEAGRGGKFRLVDEAIRRGDPRVFAEPVEASQGG